MLCGKQAIDNDMNATGQMLSALLGWSQATFASEVEIDGDKAMVTREVDGGLQTIKVNMPTVITVDLRLNEPRYASLPNIMKAKKKPLDEKTAADYGVDVRRVWKSSDTESPKPAQAGEIVGSVDELVAKLKEAGACNGCSSSCRSEQWRTGDGRHRQGRDRREALGDVTVLCAGALPLPRAKRPRRSTACPRCWSPKMRRWATAWRNPRRR